jgi:hypothetical protein
VRVGQLLPIQLKAQGLLDAGALRQESLVHLLGFGVVDVHLHPQAVVAVAGGGVQAKACAADGNVRARHTNSGSVEIECQAGPKGNRIRIHVPHEIANLCNVIDQCSAQFDSAALLQRGSALKWPATCQTVFVDVDALMMMSVIFDLCDEITAPVNTGIKFVLLCSDPDKVAEIGGRYLDAVESGLICFVPAP